MAKDPVCGMQVDEKTPVGRSEYQDKTYFFCSPSCKEAFDEKPDHFVSDKKNEHGHHH